MSAPLSDQELAELERAVERALETGDESELTVLGYGEISAVLAVDAASGRYACKRLPPFSSAQRFEEYERTLERYLSALRAGKIQVLPSVLQRVVHPDGSLTAYCVQPTVDPQSLGPERLARAGAAEAERMLGQLVECVLGAVSPKLGLDGQLSNWTWDDDGEPRYLDVTTPLLRDDSGHELLDVELFLCSLPWLLRPLVQRFMLQGILNKYYEPRGVLLDLAGNLHKEGLERSVALLLFLANRSVSPPLTPGEVRGYYASDARTWELLQRLRRADRLWQRRARGRVYPFLLPGRIERRV